LGWTPKQINSPENLQYLSYQCHRDKDSTTPDRLRLGLAQKRGRFVGLDDYLDIIK